MSELDPIHGAFSNPPPTYPLGFPIGDKVSISSIRRRAADTIYKAHHSYLPRGRQGWHYAVEFEGETVGAITFDAWPSQSTIRGYESAEIREVARVCIAHDVANLASCAMARAQDKFLEEHGEGIEMLTTYVKEGYNGTMFKALKSKGWEPDGVSEGKDRGPHHGESEVHDIYKTDKTRWVCEL